MIEADRNHGCRGAFQNLLEASMKRQHKTRSSDAAFGKNADRVALGQCLASHAQRLDNRSWPRRSVNRNSLGKSKQESQSAYAQVGCTHDKSNRPLLGHEDQKGIDTANV